MITCAGCNPYTFAFGPGCCGTVWDIPNAKPNATAPDAATAREWGWTEYTAAFTDDPASTWLCLGCYYDFMSICNEPYEEDT